MKTLKELEAEENRIYAEMKPLRAAFEAKQTEWCEAFSAVNKAKLRAEVEAELAGEKETHGNV
jgi:hypothetical protein